MWSIAWTRCFWSCSRTNVKAISLIFTIFLRDNYRWICFCIRRHNSFVQKEHLMHFLNSAVSTKVVQLKSIKAYPTIPKGMMGCGCSLLHRQSSRVFSAMEGGVMTRGGGGVLPYMSYIGMCRCEGYGFQRVYSRIGYRNQRLLV